MDPKAIKEELEKSHIFVQPDWLRACLTFLESKNPPPQRGQDLLDQVIDAYLHSDLAVSSTPVLPSVEHIDSLHGKSLPGPLLLQIQEIADISAPLATRFGELDPAPAPQAGQPARRRYVTRGGFKVKLTDGHLVVPAMEIRTCPALNLQLPAGIKVLVTGALVRRGMVMLAPSCLTVLGGSVPALVQAHQAKLRNLRGVIDPHREMIEELQAQLRTQNTGENLETKYSLANKEALPLEDETDGDASGDPSTAPPTARSQLGAGAHSPQSEAYAMGPPPTPTPAPAQGAGTGGGHVPTVSVPRRLPTIRTHLERPRLHRPGSTPLRPSTSSTSTASSSSSSTHTTPSPVALPSSRTGVSVSPTSCSASASVSASVSPPLCSMPSPARSPGEEEISLLDTSMTPTSTTTHNLSRSSDLKILEEQETLISPRPLASVSPAPLSRSGSEGGVGIASPPPNVAEALAQVARTGISQSQYGDLSNEAPFQYLADILRNPGTDFLFIKAALVSVQAFTWRDSDEYAIHAAVDDGTAQAPVRLTGPLVKDMLKVSCRDFNAFFSSGNQCQMEALTKLVERFIFSFEGIMKLVFDPVNRDLAVVGLRSKMTDRDTWPLLRRLAAR